MQGQEIKKGDPLFGLTKESVEEIREELEADEEEAKLQLDQKSLLREKAVTEAAQVYEQNQIYGEGASLEYEDSLYDLQKALEEAQKAVEEALEELEEYGTDLENLQADYEEAVFYLQETTAAVESETDTYWYLKNEEARELAETVVDHEEAQMEELEEQIREKEWELISLQAACHEALLAYQNGEADAGTAYDKRMYHLQHASEIYAIATDQAEYELKSAREDYEEASEKLQEFDSYIVDGVVSSLYGGVVTEVGVTAGDTVRKGTTLITLNHYEDVVTETEADDEMMRSIAVGDRVQVSFSAYPDGQFSGVISDIGEGVSGSDSQASWPVEISVEGDVSGLYGGMTAEVTFMTEESREVLHVPVRAVISEGGVSYVNVRDEQGNVVKKEVKTGITDGRSVEITEGVGEGEKVLIESRGKSE